MEPMPTNNRDYVGIGHGPWKLFFLNLREKKTLEENGGDIIPHLQETTPCRFFF